MTERDGSFRRLVQMVKERPTPPAGRPGRPPKHRVPTTGYFALGLHQRIQALAGARGQQAGHLVSISDLYNEAALVLITDLHQLLGDELRLPAGALSLTGVLGLRELVDRPLRVPLRELDLRPEETKRTTLHLDKPIRNMLIEISLRFGLQLRRTIHMHRILELGAAWFLAGVEMPEL